MAKQGEVLLGDDAAVDNDVVAEDDAPADDDAAVDDDTAVDDNTAADDAAVNAGSPGVRLVVAGCLPNVGARAGFAGKFISKQGTSAIRRGEIRSCEVYHSWISSVAFLERAQEQVLQVDQVSTTDLIPYASLPDRLDSLLLLLFWAFVRLLRVLRSSFLAFSLPLPLFVSSFVLLFVRLFLFSFPLASSLSLCSYKSSSLSSPSSSNLFILAKASSSSSLRDSPFAAARLRPHMIPE